MLHQRNIPVTLIERQADVGAFQIPRSYVQGLGSRGTQVIKYVPQLFDGIPAVSTDLELSRTCQITPSGEVKGANFLGMSYSTPKNRNPVYILMRHRLLSIFADYVKERTSVNAMYGATLRDIQFQPDGQMLVSVESADGTAQELRTRFIVACDGVNSAVVRKLREATNAGGETAISSARGFDRVEYFTPSVGARAKSLVLDPGYLQDVNLQGQDVTKLRVRFLGERRGRPSRRCFNMGMFPIHQDEQKRIGGLLATVAWQPGCDVWKLSSVEEGYALFQENFPQIDVRKWIREKDMKAFVEAEALTMPSISRPKSIGAFIGVQGEDVGRGGVVLVGDAAHSFPPNLGMGLNVGFEDVSALMEAIDDASADGSVWDIVHKYEEKRDENIDGALELNRVTVIDHYGKTTVVGKLRPLNNNLRTKLSKLLPGVFSPPMINMVAQRVPYGEAMMRGRQTTRRLVVGFASLLVVPILAAVLRGGR